MSSHQGPYHYSGRSPSYYESDSETPVARQFRPPGQSWPPTATIGDQSGYPQLQQSLDSVGNSLEAHDVEDMNHPFNFPGPSSQASTSLQDPGVGTDAMHATYTNEDLAFHPMGNSPFHLYNEFDYTPYYPLYNPAQVHAHDAHQHPAQDSQTTQGPSAPVYPYSSSTQHLSPSHGGPDYGTDTRVARPAPDSLTLDVTLDVVNTAKVGAGAGQHSHQSPVATSPSNQTSVPGPSRPPPSSPERKRLLPFSADDELSTARRVMPRHDRAHSTSPDHPGHSRRNSDVYGRGLSIPQERYTTSSMSSFNAPNQHPITFNLGNPDQTGIPIIDILNKTDGFARIQDGTDVFDMGKKTFTLRVLWPGYKSWSKTIAAQNWKKSRGPITRVKLAEAAATAIRDLFKRYRDKRYDPDYARWNVGPNGIQLDQICLVSLHQVSRGSWQPRLCLLGTQH